MLSPRSSIKTPAVLEHRSTTVDLIPAFIFDLVGHRVKAFAHGAYGHIYDLVVTPRFLEWYANSQKYGHETVHGHAPPTLGTHVAVKVQVNTGSSMYSDSLHDWVREAKIHQHLGNKIPDIVPKLHLAYAHPRKPLHVTVMERVIGKPISKVRVTPELYARVRDAVMRLWKAGIAHGDLHDGNMMVRPDGSVVIIDFGMSEKLPDHLIQKVEGSSRNGWRHISKHVDAVKAARGYSWYNPNGKFLKIMRRKAIDELDKRQQKRKKRTPPYYTAKST
jgi:serine/threonine protein kinase